MRYFTIPLAAGLLLTASQAMALSYDGHVTHISDADTVRVTVMATCPEPACPSVGESLSIRLAEIDAPEGDQPYGDVATAHLSTVIDNQVISINQTDVDRYGRVVGQIIYQGTWINAWLVAEGHAWVYPQYANSPQLFELEEAARNARRGLWAYDAPVEPWLWRQR